jgi:ketosteroid isomerase-like protein
MSKDDATVLIRQYFDHLLSGQLDALGKLFADDVVWHQPGGSKVSGTYRGTAALFEHLGRFMKLSQGSFRIDAVEEIMGNAALVAARIHFVAQRNGRTLAMNGVDLMRVAGGKIREVWLFSGDQAAEDAFWDAAAREEA